MEQKRTCRVCKEKKILSEFTKHRTCKDGYDSICKECYLEKQRIYSINYHEENKEKRNDYHKGHYDNHKKEKKIYQKIYSRERRKIDPEYKLKEDLRKRLYAAIKKYKFDKKDSALTHLGITVYEFMQYLEDLFLPEMDWNNHGNVWEIDHILPIAYFDFSDEEQIKQCFHFSNHQPLFKTTEIAESFGYIDHIGNRNKNKNILKK